MTDVSKDSAQRGNDTVVKTAEQRLHQSPYFFLKGLRCRFSSGVLTLRGRVPYDQLKQSAEAIVWRVDGVQQVVNDVQVVNPALAPNAVQEARSAGCSIGR